MIAEVSRRREHLWAVTVGSGLCPECGEAPVHEHRPDWWERLRYWLTTGSEVPTTLNCPEGHEWATNFAVVSFFRRDLGPRWVRLPADVLRVLLAERRMHPAPITYLMAFGIGLVLGLALDATLGWPWWLVTIVFVFLVWLFSLMSAFRDPRRDIGHQLLRVIDPERAAERDKQLLRDALTSGSLTGYELSKWEGEKSIGGWGGSPVPRSLTLRHGTLEDRSGWIEVTTQAGDRAGYLLRDELERRLAGLQVPPPEEPTIEALHQRQRDIEGIAPPDWRPASFRVEQDVVDAQIARAGSHWVAYLTAGDADVELVAKGVDPNQVHLVPIITLDPYVLNP